VNIQASFLSFSANSSGVPVIFDNFPGGDVVVNESRGITSLRDKRSTLTLSCEVHR